MPTYDYYCDQCDNQFEYFQSMKDEPLKNCPDCNSDTLKRLIGSGAGIIFKGSGFYETDYKRQDSKKSESKNESKSDSKSESKSESKSSSSESKSDSKKTESNKSKTVAA